MKGFIAALIILTAAFALSQTAPPNQQVQFEKALTLEEAQGKLQEAIALYQKLVDESQDQALAAQAQLRIGICYQKLGQKEAQSAFQKVIDNYPGQAEAVADARTQLEALRSAVPGSETALTTRLVLSNVDLWGAVSPDGRFQAYADFRSRSGDLAVRDLSSGQTRILTQDARDSGTAPEWAQYLVFSPDSGRIAYSWFNDKWFFELRIVNRDGGVVRTLYRDPEGSSVCPMDWSKDGRYILATFDNGKPLGQRMVRISVADGKVERILELSQQTPTKAAFSPDGEFIVYDGPQAEGASNRDIFIAASDGGMQETVIRHPADERVLGWSPDGKWILFLSDRTGSWGAWRVPLSGVLPSGAEVLVKEDIGEIRPFGFTGNGSFYYSTGGWNQDIYKIVVDPEDLSLAENPQPLVQRHMGSNGAAVWSPDGKRLAYLSIRGNPFPIFLCVSSGESVKEIQLTPKLGPYPYGGPRWYPDGKSLLLAGMDDTGQHGFCRIDAESGAMEVLFTVHTRPLNVLLSRRSNVLFFIVNDQVSRTCSIVMRNLENGSETQVSRLGKEDGAFFGLALSPDESTLATAIWGKDDEPFRIVKVSITDGTQTELARVPPAGARPAVDSLTWTPDGRYLLYVRTPSGPPAGQVLDLWAISAGGGEPHRIGVRSRTIGSVDMNPDGRRIALTLAFYKAELWVIQNLFPNSR